MNENDKRFIEGYEKLLNKGYCDCNEMNCIDNNSPRRILNIVKSLQNQVEKLTQENNDLEERICYLERSNNRKEETIIDLRMEQELDKYKDIIDKAIEKIQLLIDIGFDYDGLRQAESLMTLIDELVGYAKESREILRSKE